MDLLMILDAKWVCGVIHMLLDIHFGVDYCNWKKLITCIVAETAPPFEQALLTGTLGDLPK